MKNIFKNILVAGALLASVGLTSVAMADDAPAKADATAASAATASAPAATATPCDAHHQTMAGVVGNNYHYN